MQAGRDTRRPLSPAPPRSTRTRGGTPRCLSPVRDRAPSCRRLAACRASGVRSPRRTRNASWRPSTDASFCFSPARHSSQVRRLTASDNRSCRIASACIAVRTVPANGSRPSTRQISALASRNATVTSCARPRSRRRSPVCRARPLQAARAATAARSAPAPPALSRPPDAGTRPRTARLQQACCA